MGVDAKCFTFNTEYAIGIFQNIYKLHGNLRIFISYHGKIDKKQIEFVNIFNMQGKC